jgi:hypothetical protein
VNDNPENQQPQQPQQPYQQQPYQQAPQPGYPPQPGTYPPPYQQPPKKRGIGKGFAIGCGILVGLLIVCGVIAAMTRGMNPTTTANTGNTSQTTTTSQDGKATPTSAPKTWKTTHKFSGNGMKKTEEFTVGDTWKMKWTCQASETVDAYLGVSVYNDGQLDDLAVNASCKAGKTTKEETIEHKGGKVYLDIAAGVPWTIEIQEQK